MTKRIGYGKIGRVLDMSPGKWGESGGDNEPPTLLLTLADRHPDVEWVVVGRNTGWDPPRANITNMWQDWASELKMPAKATAFERIARMDAVTMPTFGTLDGIVLWMGQHGTSNSPIPKVDNPAELTSPQASFVQYSSFLLRGVNFWRKDDPLNREEVWLLPDVRNYMKGRDLKWPRRHPILSQFDWSRDEWNERYGDPRTPEECGFTDVEVVDGKWRHRDQYVASGLELVGVPTPDELRSNGIDLDDPDRGSFGVIINEARNYGMRPELTRLDAMQRYILPLDPDFVNGAWTKKSLETLGRNISPVPYEQIWTKMASVRSTFTTPSSGSGWATAKPWESFAAGTICFFHPGYDTQGHIIPTLEQLKQGGIDTELSALASWLRVRNPEDLKKRVDAVNIDDSTYHWLRDAQYRHLAREQQAARCVTTIEERLGL